MSNYNPSVRVARLYEATSRNGNIYLRGRLGLANVVVLKSSETTDDGTPIWHVLVSEPPARPDDKAKQDRQRQARPDHQAPPSPDDAERAAYQRDRMNDPVPF